MALLAAPPPHTHTSSSLSYAALPHSLFLCRPLPTSGLFPTRAGRCSGGCCGCSGRSCCGPAAAGDTLLRHPAGGGGKNVEESERERDRKTDGERWRGCGGAGRKGVGCGRAGPGSSLRESMLRVSRLRGSRLRGSRPRGSRLRESWGMLRGNRLRASRPRGISLRGNRPLRGRLAWSRPRGSRLGRKGAGD